MFSKFGIILILLSLFGANVIGTKYYMDKSRKLAEELKVVKKERDDYKYAYEECQTAMENIKVDYDKKMREYIKKLNEKTKYDKLKEIPKKTYKEGENGDEYNECEELKRLLEIYKEVERSSYFRYRNFNKFMFVNSSE